MILSIIVTVYNRETTLKRCVDSLLKQDLNEYEILLVDDGSSDGSGRIIKEYEAAFPEKIRGIWKENGGVASARNAGLAAARGEYITYVDSDDWLETNCLGKIYRKMNEEDYDILLFDAWECFSDGEKRRFPPFYDVMDQVKTGVITPEEYILARPCPWNQWTKRSVWERTFALGRFEGRSYPDKVFPHGKLYEDLGTLPALALEAVRIGYMDEACYCYYQSEGSIMRMTDYRPGYDDIFDMANSLQLCLGEKYPKEVEYLWYEHLLISGGRRYLDCRKEELACRVADVMRRTYSGWRKNPYVIRESHRKRFMAGCIYKKSFIWIRMWKLLKRNM